MSGDIGATPSGPGCQPTASAETASRSDIPSAALLALAERCEQATGPSRELDVEITVSMASNTGLVERAGSASADGTYWVTLDGGGKSLKTATAWTASTDAAMTLVPEGADCSLWWGTRGGRLEAIVEIGGEHPSSAASQALALCAASLRARAAQ